MLFDLLLPSLPYSVHETQLQCCEKRIGVWHCHATCGHCKTDFLLTSIVSGADKPHDIHQYTISDYTHWMNSAGCRLTQLKGQEKGGEDYSLHETSAFDQRPRATPRQHEGRTYAVILTQLTLLPRTSRSVKEERKKPLRLDVSKWIEAEEDA